MHLPTLTDKLKTLGIVLFVLAISTTCSQAQLDRLINRTTNKLTRELEDMAVEKISDVIAQKAAEAVEKEFDKLLMEAMKEDSAQYDRDSAYYALGNSYSEFLKGLNNTADLPPEYSFDLDILYKVSTNGDKPEQMRYFFSRSEPIMGIMTATSETDWQFILIDVGNDVTVMYHNDGDKKTAQALPNMMKLVGNLAKSESSETQEEYNYQITKLSGKERVAGYKCEGWQGADDDKRFETWLTTDLGIDWKNSFGEMIQQFSGNSNFEQSWEGMDGMVMKSENYEGDKQISSMEALEVSKTETKFVNADYDFGNQ